jgi:hypothetical protein
MPSVSAAFGEVGGALQVVLGLTRQRRLREHLGETIDLYAKAVVHDGLAGTTAHLAGLAERQATDLAAIRTRRPQRKWAFGLATIALVFAAILALPGYFALRAHHTWWTWLITVLDGCIVLLFVAVAVALLLERKES